MVCVSKKSNKEIGKSVKGAISEYQAMIQLMKENYLVAKAIDPQSLFDIVAVHKETGKIRLLDVKTKSFRKKNGWEICRSPSAQQKKLGIEIYIIDLKKQ